MSDRTGEIARSIDALLRSHRLGMAARPQILVGLVGREDL